MKLLVPVTDEKGNVIGHQSEYGYIVITDQEFINKIKNQNMRPLSVGFREEKE